MVSASVANSNRTSAGRATSKPAASSGLARPVDNNRKPNVAQQKIRLHKPERQPSDPSYQPPADSTFEFPFTKIPTVSVTSTSTSASGVKQSAVTMNVSEHGLAKSKNPWIIGEQDRTSGTPTTVHRRGITQPLVLKASLPGAGHPGWTGGASTANMTSASRSISPPAPGHLPQQPRDSRWSPVGKQEPQPSDLSASGVRSRSPTNMPSIQQTSSSGCNAQQKVLTPNSAPSKKKKWVPPANANLDMIPAAFRTPQSHRRKLEAENVGRFPNAVPDLFGGSANGESNSATNNSSPSEDRKLLVSPARLKVQWPPPKPSSTSPSSIKLRLKEEFQFDLLDGQVAEQKKFYSSKTVGSNNHAGSSRRRASLSQTRVTNLIPMIEQQERSHELDPLPRRRSSHVSGTDHYRRKSLGVIHKNNDPIPRHSQSSIHSHMLNRSLQTNLKSQRPCPMVKANSEPALDISPRIPLRDRKSVFERFGKFIRERELRMPYDDQASQDEEGGLDSASGSLTDDDKLREKVLPVKLSHKPELKEEDEDEDEDDEEEWHDGDNQGFQELNQMPTVHDVPELDEDVQREKLLLEVPERKEEVDEAGALNDEEKAEEHDLVGAINEVGRGGVVLELPVCYSSLEDEDLTDSCAESESSSFRRYPPVKRTSYRIRYGGPISVPRLGLDDRFGPAFTRNPKSDGAPFRPTRTLDTAPCRPLRPRSTLEDDKLSKEQEDDNVNRPDVWITPMYNGETTANESFWKVKRVWGGDHIAGDYFPPDEKDPEQSVPNRNLLSQIKTLVGASTEPANSTPKDGVPKMPQRTWHVKKFVEDYYGEVDASDMEVSMDEERFSVSIDRFAEEAIEEARQAAAADKPPELPIKRESSESRRLDIWDSPVAHLDPSKRKKKKKRRRKKEKSADGSKGGDDDSIGPGKSNEKAKPGDDVIAIRVPDLDNNDEIPQTSSPYVKAINKAIQKSDDKKIETQEQPGAVLQLNDGGESQDEEVSVELDKDTVVEPEEDLHASDAVVSVVDSEDEAENDPQSESLVEAPEVAPDAKRIQLIEKAIKNELESRSEVEAQRFSLNIATEADEKGSNNSHQSEKTEPLWEDDISAEEAERIGEAMIAQKVHAMLEREGLRSSPAASGAAPRRLEKRTKKYEVEGTFRNAFAPDEPLNIAFVKKSKKSEKTLDIDKDIPDIRKIKNSDSDRKSVSPDGQSQSKKKASKKVSTEVLFKYPKQSLSKREELASRNQSDSVRGRSEPYTAAAKLRRSFSPEGEWNAPIGIARKKKAAASGKIQGAKPYMLQFPSADAASIHSSDVSIESTDSETDKKVSEQIAKPLMPMSSRSFIIKVARAGTKDKKAIRKQNESDDSWDSGSSFSVKLKSESDAKHESPTLQVPREPVMPISGDAFVRSPECNRRKLSAAQRWSECKLPTNNGSSFLDTDSDSQTDSASVNLHEGDLRGKSVSKKGSGKREFDDPSITTESDSETESFSEQSLPRESRLHSEFAAKKMPSAQSLHTWEKPISWRDCKLRQESTKSLKLRPSRHHESDKQSTSTHSKINGNSSNLKGIGEL